MRLTLSLLCALSLLGACQPVDDRPRTANEIPTVESAPPVVETPSDRMTLSFEQRLQEHARIHQVAERVLAAAAVDCGATTAVHGGFLAMSRYSFGRALQDTVALAIGVRDAALVVISVAELSPANLEGMMVGDVILSIDGTDLPLDRPADAALNTLLDENGAEPMAMGLARGAFELEGRLRPRPICAIPIYVAADPTPALFTDGRSVLVNRGLLQAVSSDRDLAYLLALEIGLIIEGSSRFGVDTVPPGLFDAVLTPRTAWGAAPPPLSAEAREPFAERLLIAADRRALSYLARGGFDTAGYAQAWQDMRISAPVVEQERPLSRTRFEAMIAAETQIQDLIARGAPLTTPGQAGRGPIDITTGQPVAPAANAATESGSDL